MLKFSCPACNRNYEMDQHIANRKLQCVCGAKFRITEDGCLMLSENPSASEEQTLLNRLLHLDLKTFKGLYDSSLLLWQLGWLIFGLGILLLFTLILMVILPSQGSVSERAVPIALIFIGLLGPFAFAYTCCWNRTETAREIIRWIALIHLVFWGLSLILFPVTVREGGLPELLGGYFGHLLLILIWYGVYRATRKQELFGEEALTHKQLVWIYRKKKRSEVLDGAKIPDGHKAGKLDKICLILSWAFLVILLLLGIEKGKEFLKTPWLFPSAAENTPSRNAGASLEFRERGRVFSLRNATDPKRKNRTENAWQTHCDPIRFLEGQSASSVRTASS